MKAAIVQAYGDPLSAIAFTEIPEPPAPAAGEVLVSVEYAPINPADLLLLMGIYAVRPELPSVAGNEAVGRIAAVGAGVTAVKPGDRVTLPLSSFTWRERMLVPAAGLVPLPASADPQQLAMVRVNTVTASLLLSEFKQLPRGSWVLQNAANSGVGRSVIALAREQGLKTANIVRRPELVAELTLAGADAVVVDGPELAAQIRHATGNADIGFALDGLSGDHTGKLAAALSHGATLVTYGAMSSGAINVGVGDLLFKNLSLRGFFVGHPHHASKIADRIREGAALVAAGKLHVPVAAIYPLSDVKQAVAHAVRGGKVMLQIATG